LETLVVLGMRLLRTFKNFERKKFEIDETFDDAPWVLTITRVAPKCRDIVRPTPLRCSAWLMSVLTNVTKKEHEKVC
jgi:hypothetical protein